MDPVLHSFRWSTSDDPFGIWFQSIMTRDDSQFWPFSITEVDVVDPLDA